MARHIRRLIVWLLAGVAALAVLALLALAALWWFIDPDDFRGQIEARASTAIGRAVHLTGRLRWELGRQIYVVSEGGSVANAPGFDTQPLATWSQLRLGVAMRPLLDRRVLIDRVEVDGLKLNLQRDAQGRDNWTLQLAATSASTAPSSVTLRVGEVALDDAEVRYRDAATAADWRLSELDFSAGLPADLAAPDRLFQDLELAGRAAGGPLAADGVRFALQAAAARASPEQVQVPRFKARWGDATLAGGIDVRLGTTPSASGTLDLQVPSLRVLLASIGVTPPPMQDPATLGALRGALALRYAEGAAALDPLALSLDDTQLTGKLSLPRLEPLAIRFDLDADHVDLDRYLEPADVKGDPFELPLAQLQALDAQGVLRIREAKAAGAVAKDVRIDVE